MKGREGEEGEEGEEGGSGGRGGTGRCCDSLAATARYSSSMVSTALPYLRGTIC